MCLVITLMPLSGVKADAATFTFDGTKYTNDANGAANLNDVFKAYPQGTYFNNNPYGACCDFANEFGSRVASSREKSLTWYNKKFTESFFKNNCTGIKAGAHLRLSRDKSDTGSGNGHSIVLISVNSGYVSWADCNRYGNAENIVRYNKATVSQFMETYKPYYTYMTQLIKTKAYKKNSNANSIWVSSLTVSNNTTSGKPYLTWSKRTNAAKYKIYRKKASDSTYKWIKTTSNRYYTDTSAVPSYSYHYYVKAIKKSGSVLQSTYAVLNTCDLAQPKLTGISNVASHGGIKVSYKGVKNANRYKLYRATSASGTYEYLFDVDCEMDKGGESHYFINSGGIPGKKYYYKVQAINTNNVGADSALSKYMARTRDLARPVVSATTRSDGKIVLSWDKVEYADKYAVYRAVKGGNYSKIATITGTSVVNTKNLKNGTTYYYRVKAIDSSNENATSASSVTVSKKYENKLIGLVSESTYKSKYTNTDIYSATPYYRYKTRSMQTKTSTTPLSGWTLVSQKDDYKYGSWTTTKPTSTYETTQAYYYYAYVCNCKRLYWKSTKSDTCSSCGTKMKNLLRVYSKNDPAINFKADTDGSYFTPKVVSKTSPGNFGTIYRMTYKGTSITKFTSTSKKNTSFLWPSSAYKVTLYRTKTPATVYTYEKWSDWSDWSGWTSEYKSDSDTNKRDTEIKYYIIKK